MAAAISAGWKDEAFLALLEPKQFGFDWAAARRRALRLIISKKYSKSFIFFRNFLKDGFIQDRVIHLGTHVRQVPGELTRDQKREEF